jgi:hypothetical protein
VSAFSRLLWSGAVTAREVVLAGLGLIALSLAVFAAHIANGGFISDDWWQHADTRRFRAAFGLFGAIREFHDEVPIRGRPVEAFVTTVLHNALGEGPRPYVVWAVVAWALAATLFYVLLRQVGLERIHAGAIAGLAVLFPAGDSSRFWSTASIYSVTAIFFLLGAVIALRGMRERGRRAIVLHGVADVCFLLSLLTHEVAAVAMLFTVLLYRLRGQWSAAVRRWGADLATLAVAAGISFGLGVERKVQPLSAQLDHAKVIVREARVLFVTTGVPDGPVRLPMLIVLVLIVSGAAVWRFLPETDPARREIGRWLIGCAGGVLAIAAAYAPYVAATAYYSPIPYSAPANRVNILATPGFALLFYALAMLAAVLLLRHLPHWRLWATGLAIVMAVGLAATWARHLDREREVWNHASARGRTILDSLQRAVPSPPPGTTVYLFGTEQRIEDVPVFESSWDLDGAVKLLWDDPTLRGIPWPSVTGHFNPGTGSEGRGVSCGPQSVQPHGLPFGREHESPYGQAVFVDVGTDTVTWIRNRSACRAAVARFVTPILQQSDDAA